MSYKTKLKFLFLILICFIAYHTLMWFCITKEIFDRNDGMMIGDLGRLSYKINSYFPRKTEVTLPRTHDILDSDFQMRQVDVITIGDSFSNGGGGGLNPYYQDYIQSDKNLTVLNIPIINENYYKTLFSLINSDLLEKLKPKYIILESIERRAVDRFAFDLDKFKNERSNLIAQKRAPSYLQTPKPFFINTLNYNSVLYRIAYRFNDHAFLSKVYYLKLDGNFFTSKDQSGLLFYYEDLYGLDKSNAENIAALNRNLNEVQGLLDRSGIKLYFMPMVDKYDLYYDHILDKKYGKSRFFELLRGENKRYVFVDTKEILNRLIKSGVKDVYFSDDTHMSTMALKEIIDNMEFKFN